MNEYKLVYSDLVRLLTSSGVFSFYIVLPVLIFPLVALGELKIVSVPIGYCKNLFGIYFV